MADVISLYQKHAAAFDRERSRALMEMSYLEEIRTHLGKTATILDIGCGMGEPIARYFIDHGYTLTGVDAAPAMLAFCQQRFPGMTWIEADMRQLDLGQQFDAVIAWDSFFHLPADDQRAMFSIFDRHIGPAGLLLFTSGPDEGEAIGTLHGDPLYHASLSPADYRRLLGALGFEVLIHQVEDPDCGAHTVWLASRAAS